MAFKENGLNLSQILGLTTVSNNALCCCPITGDVFYAAGCVVVRYSILLNQQESFITLPRAVTCLHVSSDGSRIAIGERGHLPCCTIWDLGSRQQLFSLSGHKNGIGCVAISPTGRYVVTIGFKHDRQLIFWNALDGTRISTHKLGNKVRGISFCSNESYFVTCGDKHLKYWTLSKSADNATVALTGQAASILEEHKDSVFTDVCCGYGDYVNKVFCTTSTGVLCAFNEKTMIDNCIQIQSQSSFALSLICSAIGGNGCLLVGCSNGVVRAFHADSLKYLSMLPLPCPLSDHDVTPKFPACYALRASMNNQLVCIYADRSLFVWETSDISNPKLTVSKCYHRGCVWDFCFVSEYQDISSNDSRLKFATCSADNTVKVWDIKNHSQSDELIHSIEILEETSPIRKIQPRTGGVGSIGVNSSINSFASCESSESTGFAIGQATLLGLPSSRADAATPIIDLSTSLPDTEIPDRPNGTSAPRAISRHPQGNRIACGDKQGKLSLFNLDGMRLEQEYPAHSAEILTLSFSPIMSKVGDADSSWDVISDLDYDFENPGNALVLLASAGRDRLIHIFDATIDYVRGAGGKMVTKFRGFKPVCTLDYHSSSVTVVKFSADGKRFISCGGDRTMIFSSVAGPVITKLKSIQTPHGTINGLAIEATNKFVVTSGQDKRLNIWNLQSGKHMRAYKNEAVGGELYKADTDPSGMFIAVCSFDKTISIFDFFSGDLVGQVSGHSELITNVKFSRNGKNLVTIAGDGCIFVWQLSDVLVSAMADRMLELFSSAQRKHEKVSRRMESAHALPPPFHSSATSAAQSLMPPPPPMATSSPKSTSSSTSSSLSSTPSAVPKLHPSLTKHRLAAKGTAPTAAAVNSSSSSIAPSKYQHPQQETSSSMEIVGTSLSSTARLRLGAKGTAADASAVPIAAAMHHEALPKPPVSSSTNITSSSNVSGSKWAKRNPNDTYELFGKRVAPSSASNRNQFTLEIDPEELGSASATSGMADGIVDDEAVDKALGLSDAVVDDGLASSTRLAMNLEATDDVMVHISDDEEEEEDSDGDKLFKPQTNRSGDSNEGITDRGRSNNDANLFVSGSDVDPASLSITENIEESDDDELNRTSTIIDSLERSAKHLETWLEDVLRSEGQLDEKVVLTTEKLEEPIDEQRQGTSAAVDLNQSLSSAFFNDLRSSKKESPTTSAADIITDTKAAATAGSGVRSYIEEDSDSFLPPPPPFSSAGVGIGVNGAAATGIAYSAAEEDDRLLQQTNVSTVSSSSSVMSGVELKRRETAAVVNQMRDRLRGMGILQSAPADRSSILATPSPLPTTANVSGNDAAAPVAAAVRSSVAESVEDWTATKSFNEALKERMETCKRTMQEFENYRKATIEAFETLAGLRQSISNMSTLSESSATAYAPNTSDFSCTELDSSAVDGNLIADADQLLGSFQGMMSTMMATFKAQLSTAQQQSLPNSSAREPSQQQQQLLPQLNLSVDSMSIFSADQSAILPSGASNNNDSTMGLLGSIRDSQSDSALAVILDKYSDKFADLISEKVAKKLGSSLNSSSLLSPTSSSL